MNNLKEEGKLFKELIESKGLSIFKFCCLTQYGQSRLYRLVNGEADLRTLKTSNAVLFAKNLGFTSLEDFYTSCGIDLF